MKLLKMSRKGLLIPLLVLLLVFLTGPVLAGSWALVTLDELPGEIHAGENVHLSFMVRQHGKTPIHYFQGDRAYPVEPVVSGVNVETGETIEIAAVPDKSQVGRFYADVVFPSEGEWNWRIAPEPLIGTAELAPLTVLPELKAPATGLETTTNSTAAEAVTQTSPATIVPDIGLILRGAAFLLLAAGAVILLVGRRQRPQPAVVEAGG